MVQVCRYLNRSLLAPNYILLSLIIYRCHPGQIATLRPSFIFFYCCFSAGLTLQYRRHARYMVDMLFKDGSRCSSMVPLSEGSKSTPCQHYVGSSEQGKPRKQIVLYLLWDTCGTYHPDLPMSTVN